MLEAIVKNKVDVIIGNHPLIYLAQKKGLPFIKVVNKIPNSDLNLVFSIRNDYPEALSILNKGLRALSYDDKIKIHSKWFFSERKNINIKESIKDNTEIFLTNEEMAYLKNKNEISMCVLPNWLPFEQIDENIKHKGIGADIIKVISEKLNKEFVLKPTKEWAESLTNIRDRNCDILPVAMDVPSRRDAMNFTEPYVKEPFVIATTSDKFYIRDVEELSGKKIGIVKSYAIIEVLKAQNPLINIVPVENTKEGLEKVSSGELYGYVDTMPTVGYFIQKHGLFDLKIAGKLSSTIDLSIASRNDEPLLNDILQKALNTISEEEIRTIVGKWIEIKVHQEFDYTKLIYLALFFSSLFIVVLYKNRSINIINKKLELANDENINKQKMVDKYVMLLTTDLEGQITSANEAYCKRVGYEENELIGKKHSIVKHDEMPKELFHDLWKTISTNKTWQGEIKNYTKQKETVYFSVVIEPLFSSGKKIGYRSISVDITDKKRIEQLSITDKLTGLYNRFKIDELLGKQINIFKRYNTDFSVVLFDIDDFKNVNDTYGHDVGDYVLKEISTIVRKNVRKTDEIGRWGGEEFIVICTNTSKDDAFKLAEKIRVAIEHHTFKDINKITVSLGTTSFIKDEDITSLFKRVDTGLYKAKNNGKNRTISI